MKSIFRVIFLFLALSICLPCFAQSNEEITLTVSSDGPTKDDAIKNALRTAIEQAYGAFVSANTTILNDDLVKDEIVTITSGAIKDYSIVSDTEKQSGEGYLVTVKATVSLPHLINYAKNHGSECEFAGNTFGMQMKLWELQKKNELKALENLKSEVKKLLPQIINWVIEVNAPSIPSYNDNFSRGVYFSQYQEYDVEFDDPVLNYESGHIITGLDSTLNDRINNLKIKDYYQVPATIYATTFPLNQIEEKKRDRASMDRSVTSSDFGTFLSDYLENIALTENEASKMRDAGMEIAIVDHPKFRFGEQIMKFRNPESEKLLKDIYRMIGDICCSFVIEDNMGNKSDFYFDEIRNWPVPDSYKYQNIKTPSYKPHVYKGNGSIYVTSEESTLSGIPFSINRISSNYRSGAYNDITDHEIEWEDTIFPGLFYSTGRRKLPLFEITFHIPKEEIWKYSSFKIVKK